MPSDRPSADPRRAAWRAVAERPQIGVLAASSAATSRPGPGSPLRATRAGLGLTSAGVMADMLISLRRACPCPGGTTVRVGKNGPADHSVGRRHRRREVSAGPSRPPDRAAGDHTITVVGNVGDDIWLFGLKVSPDLDTVMYTALGGGIDEGPRLGSIRRDLPMLRPS